MKAKRPCNHPGCNQLVDSGKCDKHRKQTRHDQDSLRGNFRQRGYSSDWDKVRKIKVRYNPLCERCEKDGKVTPTKLVHHIQSISKGGNLLDMSNLMSLCVKCHDDIHMQQGDKW